MSRSGARRRVRTLTVLVTGATRGLGLAIARRLVSHTKHRLVLTARPSSLQRFHEVSGLDGSRVVLRPLDVTVPEQRRAVVTEISERWRGVDVLINNAGVSYRSVVEHVTEDERIDQMNVNFFGPMALAVECLPHMRARRWGRIINVSSVGGMMAMPTMAVYSASKFALEGASEAMWYELRPWGVAVTLVEPGFVNSTSFQNVRHTEMSARAAEDATAEYHQHYRSMAPFIARLMRSSPVGPAHIARRIVNLIDRRRPPLRLPVTPDAWVFSRLRCLLPPRAYHALLYRALPGVANWGPR